MTESVDDQMKALVARVEELGVEVASLRRAMLSLGSALLAGGPPGGAAYIAWHKSQEVALQADAAAEAQAKKIAELEAALAAAKAPPSIAPVVDGGRTGQSAAGGTPPVPPSPPSTSGADTGSSGSSPPAASPAQGSSSTPSPGASAPGRSS